MRRYLTIITSTIYVGLLVISPITALATTEDECRKIAIDAEERGQEDSSIIQAVITYCENEVEKQRKWREEIDSGRLVPDEYEIINQKIEKSILEVEKQAQELRLQYYQQYDILNPTKRCPYNSRGMTAEEKALYPGSAKCICLEGYQSDPYTRQCIKIPLKNGVKVDIFPAKTINPFVCPDNSIPYIGRLCRCKEGFLNYSADDRECFSTGYNQQVKTPSTTIIRNMFQINTGLPSDTEPDAWYIEYLEKFIDEGLIDPAYPFGPSDPATREAFVHLIVEMHGGASNADQYSQSFDDIFPADFYNYPVFEEAARKGWISGDGGCYGERPCYARPYALINRAEAATLIIRVFKLANNYDSVGFSDIPSGAWFSTSINVAAGNCILQGYDGKVRPEDNMNNAEMIAMLFRADNPKAYPNCQ